MEVELQRSKPGVCSADQSAASGAAAARTFCSAPTEDICYQLFISLYTTSFFLTERFTICTRQRIQAHYCGTSSLLSLD